MISNDLLKKKILDEAIHGRLVENDLSLPAVGVEEITDNVPFDIPNNWKWAKLFDVSEFNVGKTPPTKDLTYWGDEIDWVSISDMNHRKTVGSTKRKLSNKSLKNIFNNKLVPSGTLLMSFKLTIGRLAITSKECVHNEAIISIYPKQYLLRDYLINTLDALDLEKNVKSAIKGKTLNSKSLANIFIPIPPIEEQERIVKKIEELFELIDTKEKKDQEKEKLKTLLKEKILDSAIRGKLIENDLSLSAVDVEEIKDNVPFEIPNNWKWTTFYKIIDVRDGTHDSPKYVEYSDYPLITSKNLTKNGLDFENVNYLAKKDYESINVRSFVDDGDILFAMIGSIGNPVLVNKTRNFAIKNVALFKCSKKIYNKYLYYYLQSQGDMSDKTKGGVQKFVSLKILRNYLIPIPPLEQQKKIVEKIEKCFELIEQL